MLISFIFHYSGSRKFLSDIQNFQCTNLFAKSNPRNPFGVDICLGPLKLSTNFKNININNIKHVIAIDQVGITTNDAFYTHASVNGSALAAIVAQSAANTK